MESSEQPAEPWLDAYRRGADLRESATIAGVSHQSVANWLDARGIPRRSASETEALRVRVAIEDHADAIRSTFLRSRSVTETAVEVGVPEKVVKKYLQEELADYKVLARTPRNKRRHYASHELVASLKEAAPPGSVPLTVAAYERFWRDSPVLPDGRARPGPQAMGLRFGSWTAAQHAAGLPVNPRSGPTSDFDAVTAVTSLVACWADLEKAPSVSAYDKWQRGKEAHASSATVRKLFESWDHILVRAWQIRYGIQLDTDDVDVAIPPGLATGGGDFAPYSPADEDATLRAAKSELESFLPSLEKAVRNHNRIQNAFVSALQDRGRTPFSPALGPKFDVAFIDHDDSVVVAEIKSCTDLNLEGQLRLGLGQILRYTHQLRKKHQDVRPVLVTQLQPPTEWVDLLDELGVASIHEKALKSGLQRLLRDE